MSGNSQILTILDSYGFTKGLITQTKNPHLRKLVADCPVSNSGPQNTQQALDAADALEAEGYPVRTIQIGELNGVQTMQTMLYA